MKNYLLLSALLVSILFTSCSNTEILTNQQKMIATWQTTQNAVINNQSTVLTITLSIYSNGTFSRTTSDAQSPGTPEVITGTYTSTETTIAMTYTKNNAQVTDNAVITSITDTTMVIVLTTSSNDVQNLTLTKLTV